MKLRKEVIVLGDVEMGAGTLTDDFISDKALSSLILQLRRRKHAIDLVFNGDTFDFLKCPYITEGKETYPRHITPEISVSKLDSIYQAHKKVFTALEKFAGKRSNHLYFIIGNHDYDLAFPEVKEELRKILGHKQRVHIAIKYSEDSVYIEHGHQYDFLYKVNFENLFLRFKGKTLLNLPWTALGLISKFMGFKEEHPFMDRVFPRSILISSGHMIAKKFTHRTLGYILKSIFYYPFRYYSDPTYSFPRQLLGDLIRRFKSFQWDVDDIMDVFLRRKRRAVKKNKLIVLGHIHEKMIKKQAGAIVVHPGSWRDEYDMQQKTGRLFARAKRYMEIKLGEESGDLNWELIEFPIKRSNSFKLENVIKDEKKHLLLAAKEEGYNLKINNFSNKNNKNQ